MSLHRYAARRDENERAIIDALEDHDCAVHQLRDGVDLLVQTPSRRLVLLEVKSRRGVLSPAQRKFRERFEFHVVRTVVQALAAVSS